MFTIEVHRGGWVADDAFRPFATADEAVDALLRTERPYSGLHRRVVGEMSQWKGGRVSHNLPMRAAPAPCRESEAHRNGAPTGRVTFDRERRMRVEVKWDCGHVRWPLAEVLHRP